MIAALILADLALVVVIGTFAMLIYYLIANIAAIRLPPKHRQYPSWIPVIEAISCIGLIVITARIHGSSDYRVFISGL